jgi:hypothetical protein
MGGVTPGGIIRRTEPRHGFVMPDDEQVVSVDWSRSARYAEVGRGAPRGLALEQFDAADEFVADRTVGQNIFADNCHFIPPLLMLGFPVRAGGFRAPRFPREIVGKNVDQCLNRIDGRRELIVWQRVAVVRDGREGRRAVPQLLECDRPEWERQRSRFARTSADRSCRLRHRRRGPGLTLPASEYAYALYRDGLALLGSPPPGRIIEHKAWHPRDGMRAD